MKFRDHADQLLRLRQEFRVLPAEAQDQQLMWLFMFKSHHAAKRPSTATEASAAKRARSSPERVPTTPDSDTLSQALGFVPTTAAEDSVAERIATTPKSTSEDLDVESLRSARKAQQARTHAKSKQRHPRKPRHTPFQMEVLGQRVCQAAAKTFMGIGVGRLARGHRELADGRRTSTMSIVVPLHRPAKKTQSVLSFLWRIYPHAGESMPDKFSFTRRDAKPSVVEPAGAATKQPAKKARTPPGNDLASDDASSDEGEGPHDLEEEERSTTAGEKYHSSGLLRAVC